MPLQYFRTRKFLSAASWCNHSPQHGTAQKTKDERQSCWWVEKKEGSSKREEATRVFKEGIEEIMEVGNRDPPSRCPCRFPDCSYLFSSFHNDSKRQMVWPY